MLSTGLGARRPVDWKLSMNRATLLKRMICSTLMMTCEQPHCCLSKPKSYSTKGHQQAAMLQ